MSQTPPLPDWSLIQSFLAVAETGSLSGAARRLNRSQPTLGRHIQSLEQDLGSQLFERHARGLRLSADGTRLLPMAQQMNAQMNAIALNVAGQSQQLQGTVRITASVFASHYLLPPILAHIRKEEPLIELELAPSDSSENLLFRAADIAVRMYRPSQLDIVTRHVCDLPLGIFAAQSYLSRRGSPNTPDQLREHDLVGYDSNELILHTTRSLGWSMERSNFATRCDNQATYWQLVRAGCGIGFSQCNVGRADPLVKELDLGIEIPPLPVWLAAHQAMRQTPRIARVWSLLAKGLQQATPLP
ncbi:LysR family transcriptional regulator [Parasedimentitalea huanghaiensis]|uniref:LysR family transcriptional regulator n=1 Tax=Parasedimentitalea huanghaiensis TaxID=2682100 RepID=A0A6L6WCI1_9RHOB|nr:LysR family transcriptional regulator [Zongyanglinia huanghaiensis]MVO15404.1 LysR family transcriptional regulator [Zongyanglinia huanghaiensis]